MSGLPTQSFHREQHFHVDDDKAPFPQGFFSRTPMSPPGVAGRVPVRTFYRSRRWHDAFGPAAHQALPVAAGLIFAVPAIYDLIRLFASLVPEPAPNWLGDHMMSIVWIAVQLAIGCVALSAGITGRTRPDRLRLDLYPEGLVLRLPAWYMQAPWHAFAGIGDTLRGPRSVSGLVLAEPLRFTTIRHLRGVPLALLDPHWQTGEIGMHLRQFAPHLFPDRAWEYRSGQTSEMSTQR